MQQRRRVLHRETARDVAHGREQRQPAGTVFHGFERDRGKSDGAQTARELGKRREMQVAEQQVIFPQAREIRLDRFLDPSRSSATSRTTRPRWQHGHTDITKSLVTITTLLARAMLDEHFVSGAHQLDAGCGNEPDSALAGFQFTRNANTHGMSSHLTCGLGRRAARSACRTPCKPEFGQTCHLNLKAALRAQK
jgi:hypothetical protein